MIQSIFKSPVKITIALLLLIMIPLTVYVAQQQQTTRQEAGGTTSDPTNLRMWCIAENCTKIRAYWDPPTTTPYWYYVRLINQDTNTQQAKWTRNPKIEFDVTPAQMHYFIVRGYHTIDFTACDLSTSYLLMNLTTGQVITNNPGNCQGDALTLATSYYSGPNKSEDMQSSPVRTRQPFEGEKGIQNPTTLPVSCNASCSQLQLSWNSQNPLIYPKKKFLIRTPPLAPGTIPWQETTSYLFQNPPQNQTFRDWTLQEFQGETDFSDFDFYYGGIRSNQIPFDPFTTAPNQSPTSTPQPTTPPQITAIPSFTQTPTQTLTQTPNASISFSIALPGIKKCPTQSTQCVDNNTPNRKDRTVTLEFYTPKNQPAFTTNATVQYNPTTQQFSGTLPIPPSLSSGIYIVKFTTPSYLSKRIPGFHQIDQQKNYTFPSIKLIPGDASNDNQLNILDYNIFINCYKERSAQTRCNQKNQATDYNDDGIVDIRDYLILFSQFAFQEGD